MNADPLAPRGRPRPSASTIWFVVATLAALAVGAVSAASWWWTSDDAFIAFRCARNLVEGYGLVFNPGERVEAHTNFLWTLWVAAGLAAGFGAEEWADGWGIAFYLASILLLALDGHATFRRLGARGWFLPVAALGAALHPDWSAFATGGLETSVFTFLLLCGFLLVLKGLTHAPALAGAACAFALASLARPDGALPALAAGACVLVWSRPRLRGALIYAGAFAVVWVPCLLWRLHYYGEVVPNSYYAKSGGLAWYAQGGRYVQLYLERYWALLAGPALMAGAAVAARGARASGPAIAAGNDPMVRRQAALAGAIAVPYAFYVARVGGDFMFARMLIPVTPFLLMWLELGCGRAFASRPVLRWGFASAALGAIALSPPPVTGTAWRYEIANEPMYYTRAMIADLDHAASVLRTYFDGLPARVVFYGAEARLAYEARFPVAIEGETGLTEPAVAKQPLMKRGRVGHEKPPGARYLILERGADITFSANPQRTIDLFRHIPDVRARFDDRVYGQLLRWNAPLIEELRRRGAVVQDFPAYLDAYIAGSDRVPVETLRADFERFDLFYFSQVDDPPRKEAFLRRLRVPSGF